MLNIELLGRFRSVQVAISLHPIRPAMVAILQIDFHLCSPNHFSDWLETLILSGTAGHWKGSDYYCRKL